MGESDVPLAGFPCMLMAAHSFVAIRHLIPTRRAPVPVEPASPKSAKKTLFSRTTALVLSRPVTVAMRSGLLLPLTFIVALAGKRYFQPAPLCWIMITDHLKPDTGLCGE
jgi:hypothetical protein